MYTSYARNVRAYSRDKTNFINWLGENIIYVNSWNIFFDERFTVWVKVVLNLVFFFLFRHFEENTFRSKLFCFKTFDCSFHFAIFRCEKKNEKFYFHSWWKNNKRLLELTQHLFYDYIYLLETCTRSRLWNTFDVVIIKLEYIS